MEGIYLDYAATSAVRPDEVIDAVARYLREVGATPGRSGHHLALEAGRIAFRCRVALSLLKRTKVKGSIRTRRLRAGWDDDYLLKVLQGIQAN